MDACHNKSFDCCFNSSDHFENNDSSCSIKVTEADVFLSGSREIQSNVALTSRSTSKQTFEPLIATIVNEKVPFAEFEGWKKQGRNAPVFPILFQGKKHFKIDRETGLGPFSKEVEVIYLGNNDKKSSIYRQNCELRLSNMLLNGFNNVCKVVIFSREKPVPYNGSP